MKRAIYYDKIERNPKAALVSYEAFLTEFPQSDRAAETRVRAEALRAVVQQLAPQGLISTRGGESK